MDLRSQRGTTLLEAMVAVGVMLVAATGMLGLHVQQLKMNGEARRSTEAVALARDLVENISTWPYGDARLANTQPTNDVDIADDRQQFETADFVADHGEADLGAWNGLPSRDGFNRYWNVAYVDDVDGNGVPGSSVGWDAVRIAVIVRWRTDVGWRRVVLTTSKANPAEVQ